MVDATTEEHTDDGPCPSLEAWTSLLLGERFVDPSRPELSRTALLRHLLNPCDVCWRRLPQLVTAWDAANLPLDNAPSMAVHSAAAGMAGRPVGRLALMRPLHRRDAFRASGCRLAFCRLLLHETLAVALRPDSEDPSGAFDEARCLLADPCVESLSGAQRHDLEALLAIYQAYDHMLRGDGAAAESLMATAREGWRRGEGSAEPEVTWWTFSASIGRLADVEDDRSYDLWCTVAAHLRQALQRLPVEDHAEQRAELLHDLATLEMQLGNIASARRLLARTDVLLERLGEVAGPYLKSIVWLAQAQAEARWAMTLPDPAAQRNCRQRSSELFDRAVELGFLNAQDLEPERRQLAALRVD